MNGYSSGHFVVGEVEGLVGAEPVVGEGVPVLGEVVWEHDIKLGLDVVVPHLMKKAHGLGSSPVSGNGAYINKREL